MNLLSVCMQCVGQRQLTMESPRSTPKSGLRDLEDIIPPEAVGKSVYLGQAALQPAVCTHCLRAEPARAWRGQMEELRTSQLGSRTKGCLQGSWLPHLNHFGDEAGSYQSFS